MSNDVPVWPGVASLAFFNQDITSTSSPDSNAVSLPASPADHRSIGHRSDTSSALSTRHVGPSNTSSYSSLAHAGVLLPRNSTHLIDSARSSPAARGEVLPAVPTAFNRQVQSNMNPFPPAAAAVPSPPQQEWFRDLLRNINQSDEDVWVANLCLQEARLVLVITRLLTFLNEHHHDGVTAMLLSLSADHECYLAAGCAVFDNVEHPPVTDLMIVIIKAVLRLYVVIYRVRTSDAC